jgi:beta-lactam-binding protein with PASTA domain
VVTQSPEPDAEVAPGSTVTAEINVGPATTKIPGGLIGHNVDKAMEKLADAGFTHVTAMPVDNPPKNADADEVLAVDPREGERAALEEDVVVRYAARAAGRATSAPTARGAPATKERSATDKASRHETGTSSPANKQTQSSSPDDQTSTSDPTATKTSPSETAASAPASSGNPSGQQSGEGNPDGEGAIPGVSASGIPAGEDGPPGGADALAPAGRIKP